MATKMTKRDYFNRILGYAHEEDKEFILHELDLLAKKNSGYLRSFVAYKAQKLLII
jgi:hypothetical protein